MAGIRSYAGSCFSKAFHPSWGLLDVLSTLAGAIVPILANFYPQLEPSMIEWAWQIPVGAAVGLFMARLCASPYLVHRDVVARMNKCEQDLRDIQEVGPDIMLGVSLNKNLVIQNHAGVTAERIHIVVEKHAELELRPQGFPIAHLQVGDERIVTEYLLRQTTGKTTEAFSHPQDLLEYCRTLKKEFDLLNNSDGLPVELRQSVNVHCFNKHNVRFDRKFQLVYNLITEDLNLYPTGTVRVTRQPEAPPAVP